MPTLTLRPNAGTTFTQHSRYGDTANWKCCDEAASDSDTTYVYGVSFGDGIPMQRYDIYALSDPSVALGVIQSVTVYVVGKWQIAAGATNQYVAPSIRIGSNTYAGVDQLLGPAYASFSNAWGTDSPATGAPWTWGEITTLGAGFRSTVQDDAAGTSEIRVTQVYIEVVYSSTFQPSTGTLTIAGNDLSFPWTLPPTPAPGPTVSVEVTASLCYSKAFTRNICRSPAVTAEIYRTVAVDAEI